MILPHLKILKYFFKPCGHKCLVPVRFTSKLVQVGKLAALKTNGNYEPGQLFLHRIFAYRGVVLFPWTAKVHDRTNMKGKGKVTSADSEKIPFPKDTDVKSQNETYYQVLIDGRDTPHIRSQAEAVTFLGADDGKKAIFVVPGLDYVSHKDIIPYTSKDKKPIQHDLFEKFFTLSPGKSPTVSIKDSLTTWKKKNKSLLNLSEVHVETTENVRVTVIPFFMGQRDSPGTGNTYWWRYCIRLENLGSTSVQLRERMWRLFSLSGTLETVRGRGVVGIEPVLSKTSPAFQYSSHVNLPSPTGHMWGTFRMEREDGYCFDCKIPPFSLESKTDEKHKS